MMRIKTVAAVLAIVAILSLVLAVPVFAATPHSQTWYLDSQQDSGQYLMEKGTSQSGTVAIPMGTSVMFMADEVAAVDVTFPVVWDDIDAVWEVHLCFDLGADIANTNVEVGSWDGTTFTAFSQSEDGRYMRSSQETVFQLQITDAVVLTGDRLALKVSNNSQTTDATLKTSGCSNIQSPCGDPGYPTPEIATGILLGIGALGLAGYMVIRRRNSAQTQA